VKRSFPLSIFGNVHEYALESGGSRDSTSVSSGDTTAADANPGEDVLSEGFTDVDSELEATS
jgi:hypothetical protein